MSPLVRAKDRIFRLEWRESSFQYDTPRFGAIEHPRTKTARGGWIVSLATGIQKEPPHVLEWVLWREAILSLLIPQIRQIKEAADLGLYGGLKFGIKNPRHREYLKKIWQQISLPQYYPYYQYNPHLGFPMFNIVVEGKFLQLVIPWLNTMRTIHQTPIDSTTYTAALERWMLETHRILNDTEVRILQILASKPLFTQHQIAEELNMSSATISYVLNSLAQKHLLRLENFINLPLIGLDRYAVIIHVQQEETRQQLQDLFLKIRYTHSIRRVSDVVLLATFMIPNPHVEKFLKWIEQLCQKKNLAKPQIDMVTHLVLSRNFQDYTPNVGWPNDFSPLLEKIHNIVIGSSDSTESHMRILKYDYDKLKDDSKFPLKLLPEHFTYFLRSTDIVSMTDRITSRPSKEVHKAGLTVSKHMSYRRRVQLLEKSGVSTLRGFGLFHIGLNTIIEIFIRHSNQSVKRLLKAFQLLPYLDAIILEDKSSAIIIQVPNSVGVDIHSSLRTILADCDYDAQLSVKSAWQTFVGLPSPITSHNYDFENGRWLWPEDLLLKVK